MPLSKERMKIKKCQACHRVSFMHRHHLTYEPEETIEVCAACHKKIHMVLAGTRRVGSNSYINPLFKLGLSVVR